MSPIDRRSALRVLSAAALAPLVPAARGAEGGGARPTPQQASWQDMEVEMFLCLDPCTWQGREYDNHSTPIDRINPSRLDTDQWVATARSMGAGQLLFVAKHTGGFCWWQTETSTYGVKETPWRGGKGDVVADLAASCRKAGIKLALYLSPADDMFGAKVGGRTKNPEDQARYRSVFRQQWTELLSRYGEIGEVWFDGSSAIDVGDILQRHSPKAMVFQSPQATIRWVGNERGIAPYPCWNSVTAAVARSGVATGKDGTPDGEVWLPVECDARIRSTWFWNPANAATLKSVDELMRMYLQSVGHGGVLLLNNTPDTSGLIPEADVRRSAEFGEEIRRCYAKSIAETGGEGDVVELRLGRSTAFDCVVTMEDTRRGGERLRQYVIEAQAAGEWKEIARGSAVGHKKIDSIPAVTAERVRFRAIEAAGRPLIRKLAVYDTRRNKESA